jgi:hypothetical protein
MSAPITGGTRVTTGAGRTGVAVYDSGASSDLVPAVLVVFADSTYAEFTRGALTQITGGWIPGTGI